MINAYLYVDDKKYRLLNLFFNFNQSLGTNNKPVSKPVGGQLHATIPTNDKDLNMLDWTIHDNLQKKGRIEIMSRDNTSIGFKMEFANAFATSASYIYDSNSSEPMNYTITITAGILRINGDNSTIHKQTWDDGTAFNAPTPLTVSEENNEESSQPLEENYTLEQINWIDDQEDVPVKSTEFKDTIRVFIKVTNIAIGEKVTLKLYTKSDGLFDENNFKEYEAEVIEHFKDSQHATCEVNIKEEWGINTPTTESNIIDTLFVKATYKNISKDFFNQGLDIVVQKLKGIYFKKGNDEAYYYEGVLYSATEDKKGMVLYGDESPRRQFRETKEALDIICTQPIGKAFIDDICKRSNPYFIKITRENSSNNTKRTTVSWSPGDNSGGIDENGSTKRAPFLSLVHELWHAWENWSQPNMLNPVWVLKNEENKLGKSIVHKELTASTFENQIRVEHNLSRRKWYSYKEEEDGTKTGLGQIF